jgi:NAD(P)-dependent dehydrogenase (short-subunit alcohol dehydrogenase family)
METKTVVITGAAFGIGRCTAQEFARAGYDLVLVDRDAEGLAETERTLGGRRVIRHVVDVADPRAVAAMAKEVLAAVGHIDVLVNNAGIAHTGELASTKLATWRALMAVNFWGPLHLIDAFLPSMRARRAGAIVNVSSGQAFLRMPGWGAYATSKVALAGFSEILHHEVAGSGVRVSTIYPFLVKGTHLYDDAQPKSVRARLSMQVMMRLADAPEKTARRIRAAATDGRRLDRVSWLNDVGYYGQLVPPLARLWGRSMAWLFRESERPDSGARGFRVDEEMTGYHELEPGFGTPGRRPMSFRVSWGADDIGAWLRRGATTEPLRLDGRVAVDGLVEDAACSGTLELRYGEGRIRYAFDFAAHGRRYHFVGEKVNIKPWNLPTSHTTCFGRLTDDDGRLVSTSVLLFRLERLPALVKSFRSLRTVPAAEDQAVASLGAVGA